MEILNKYQPDWGQFEKDIHSDDPTKAAEAAEKFVAAREEALNTDETARRWEEGRKLQAQKDKKYFIEDRLAAEKQEEKKFVEGIIKDIQTGGNFDYGLKPCPGYILVEVAEETEESRRAKELGLIVEVADNPFKNTGLVLDIGEKLECPHCFTHRNVQPTPPPVKPGDKILFKLGAGLDLTLKDKKCKLMTFGDALGVFTV